MQVRRLLRYYGQLKGRSQSPSSTRSSTLARAPALRDWADKRIDQLSKGMAQKVQFISAIVSKPRLLILDEPFSGLDPVNAESLRDAVLELRRDGTTIVFSTHDMGAAERMCDRIFMIFKGNKVLDGSLDEIQARYGQDTVRVRTSAGVAGLAGLADVESVNDHGNFQDVRLKGDPQAFLRRLLERTAVTHFEITKPSLHDIFVRIARPSDDELQRAGQGGQMKRVLTIAQTEFLTLVKTKAFIIGILLMPVLMVGVRHVHELCRAPRGHRNAIVRRRRCDAARSTTPSPPPPHPQRQERQRRRPDRAALPAEARRSRRPRSTTM